MSDVATPEVWLRGRPVEGVPALLQPVAHGLLQCREEVESLLSGMAPDRIWRPTNGAASIGFHVRHAIGSLDRLLTYARGAALSDAQRQVLALESQPDRDLTAGDLQTAFATAIERALDQLRATDHAVLTHERAVGRSRLPSTVIGLLFHAAEHTQRHVGQATTTSKARAYAFDSIGVARTPFIETAQIPKGPGAEHRAEGAIEIAPAFESGLADIEGFSHLLVIWVFDRVDGVELTAWPPSDDRPHGVFATRSPQRPNPIGLTTVQLLGREGCRLRVAGVDMLDGTPVLDVKPYLSNVPADVLRRGWLDEAEARRAGNQGASG
jgi:tRNA (adenine37-N6)-methyltransferase